jgi:hypothetical protein
MLGELRDWMSEQVVPWMLLIYARGATNAEEARSMLQGVGSRFDFHINKTLCDLRTNEIFDIIIDFPESNGALMDLKDCLQRVDQRPALVKALRQAYAGSFLSHLFNSILDFQESKTSSSPRCRYKAHSLAICRHNQMSTHNRSSRCPPLQSR